MNYLGASTPANFKFGNNILYNTILDTTIYGPTGPKGDTGKGFTVFATTTTYSGLNSIIATGGNVGEFVIVTGGDLFLYMGTGSGQTGPGNSYNYSGDITDESKLIGTTGPTGPYGKTGPVGPTGNIGPQGPIASSFTVQNFGNYKILVSTGTNDSSVSYNDFIYNGSSLGVGTNTPSGIITAKQPHLFNIASNSGSFSVLGTHDVDGSLNTRIVVSGSTRGISGGGIEYLTSTGSLGSHVWYTFPTLEKMRLTPDGKLGIGLSNPGYTLDVNGAGRVLTSLGVGTALTNTGKLAVNTANTTNSLTPGAISSWDNTYSVFGPGASTSTSGALGIGWNSNLGGVLTCIQPGVLWNNMNYQALSHRFYVGGSAVSSLSVASNGNVGIGTSSPNQALEVRRDTSSSYIRISAPYSYQKALDFYDTTNNVQKWAVYNTGNSNNLQFWNPTGGDVMTITSTGNVGINTVNPKTLLHVSKTGTANFMTTLLANGAGQGIDSFQLGTFLGGTSNNPGDITSRIGTTFDANGNFYAGINFHRGTFATDQYMSLSTSATERMRIDSNGNVGIGTSSVSDRLHIKDVATIFKIESTSNSDPSRILFAPNGYNWYLSAYGSASSIYSNKLCIFDNFGNTILCMSTGSKVSIGSTNTTYQLELSSDSAAKPTTNTWTISSDKRVKQNIVDADLDICHSNIINIPLRRYGYNTNIKEYSTSNIDDVNVVGFIADEFKQYFPKAVNEVTQRLTVPKDFFFDDMTNIQTETAYITSAGATGANIEDPDYKVLIVPDFKGLNTSQIIPTLVGAVKKQSQIIQQQRQEIDTLKQNYEDLVNILKQKNILP
jgi:hypothetical protein